MIYVRPTTKQYGKGNKIEGYIKKGARVVIIEDHISTAASVIQNAKSIREVGGKVKYCVTTTTYETKKSIENFKDAKLTLVALTTGRFIVETAFKEGYLTKKQKDSVDLWFADPPRWAGKTGV